VTLYLTLNQVLHIAEEVTVVSLEMLARVSQLHLLASAVAAPQTELIGLDPYPEFSDKASASALAFQIARNYALPDGNKRLAFLSAFEFCWINGFEMEFDIDDAEAIFFGLAGGEITQEALAIWIKKTLRERN